MNAEKRMKNEYFRYDLAAAALGLGLLLFFALTAPNGVSAPDDAFYYTVPHRLMLGEKLIADEWNVTQLTYLLSLLPDYLYTKLAGGYDGIVLSMRYLFIGINAVFYAYVYKKLRPYRLLGLLAAFSFSALIVQTYFSITYFTAAPMAILGAFLVLSSDADKRGTPRRVFAGVLLACGVLAEPYLIAGVFAWFVLVLLRERRIKKGKPVSGDHAFLLDRRVFLPVICGAAGVFAVFMCYMAVSGAFENFAAAFPYLASGRAVGMLDTILLKKSGDACLYYGVPFIAGELAVLAAAAVLRKKKALSLSRKRLLFACDCVLLTGSLLFAGIGTLRSADAMPWVNFIEFHTFSLLLFSPVMWLLSEKKDPRVTALWAVSLGFTLLVDASSAAMLGSGAGLMRAACILQTGVLLPELRSAAAPASKKAKSAAPAAKRARAAFSAALALCAATLTLWDGGYVLAETVYKPEEKLLLHLEDDLDCALTTGPLKGLRTTERIADIYSKTLRDLDTVKAAANGAPAAVLELAPYTYLYLDLPYGAFSSWFEYYEPERLAYYWQLRPAQQPAYIYIPYYVNGLFDRYTDDILQLKLNRLFEWVDGELTEGEAGYVIRVRSVRAPADFTPPKNTNG